MSGKIFLITENESLEALEENPYASEDLLQNFLERYPDLLAGELINAESPRRWILVSREMVVPDAERGGRNMYLDHLFLDQDGIPTLVEVKRSSDMRIRREVVGQMLDYAANAVVYWPVETIRNLYEKKCQNQNVDAEQRLRDFLDTAPDADFVADNFWQKVKTNLQAGSIRMVFVADEIPVQLRRVVEFLNEQMDPAEVIAVELKQYVGPGIRTIVPRMYGVTAEAEQRKSTGVRQTNKWNEEKFFNALVSSNSVEVVEATKHIYEWFSKRVDEIWWGEGVTVGSFVPVLYHKDVKHQLLAVWTRGYVEIYFQWYQYKSPFTSWEKRDEFRLKLNEIQGVDLLPDVLERRPSISIEHLVDRMEREKFFTAFDWFLRQIKAV